jgi:hypothetical protein
MNNRGVGDCNERKWEGDVRAGPGGRGGTGDEPGATGDEPGGREGGRGRGRGRQETLVTSRIRPPSSTKSTRRP